MVVKPTSSLNKEFPLTVTNGGTGVNIFSTANSLLASGANTDSDIVTLGQGTTGQYLQSKGTSEAPSFSDLPTKEYGLQYRSTGSQSFGSGGTSDLTMVYDTEGPGSANITYEDNGFRISNISAPFELSFTTMLKAATGSGEYSVFYSVYRNDSATLADYWSQVVPIVFPGAFTVNWKAFLTINAGDIIDVRARVLEGGPGTLSMSNNFAVIKQLG